MKANKTQIAGQHYRASIQTWDYILAHDLGFLEGNVIKYVTRYKKKDGLQDLLKAKHYLDKLIEVENERLCRASDTDEPSKQTIAGIVAESEARYGRRAGSNVAYREQVIAELHQRNEAGYGQPTCIGEIT